MADLNALNGGPTAIDGLHKLQDDIGKLRPVVAACNDGAVRADYTVILNHDAQLATDVLAYAANQSAHNMSVARNNIADTKAVNSASCDLARRLPASVVTQSSTTYFHC